jgi:ATP-binding cassette subfamily C protein
VSAVLPAAALPTAALPTAALPTASAAETRRAVRVRLVSMGGPAALTSFVLLGASVAGLAVPRLLGGVVDAVLDGSADTLRWLVLGLLAAVIGQALLTGAATTLVASTGERFLASLREEVVDRSLEQPLEVVEAAGVGDLVSRVSGDVEATSDAVRVALPAFTISALSIGLTLVGLALLDWRLALAGLMALPVQVAATRWYLRRSRPMYAAERVAIGRRAAQLTRTIGGADTIRALRRSQAQADAAAAASSHAMDRTLVAARTRAAFFSYLNTAELIGLGCTLVVGFLTVRAGIVSIGAATAAALYFQRLFDPIGALLTVLDTFQDAGAALARLVGVTQLPAPTPPTDPRWPSGDDVVVDDVGFRYAGVDEPALRHVELSITAGERVAVVGRSGAGKSTLAKLVAGIHHADSGQLRLGGAPLEQIPVSVLGEHVALVMQDVHVFAGTVAENLRLAHAGASDAELWAALERTGAATWVRAAGAGLDTEVGAGGQALDAFAAQQIALARIELSPARVVVLDEATAEAGSVGARQLDEAALEVTRSRTTVVVAHRLGQAASADRVVVMDGGRVVEVGTHDELLAADGPYAQLWSAWSGARPGAELRRPER